MNLLRDFSSPGSELGIMHHVIFYELNSLVKSILKSAAFGPVGEDGYPVQVYDFLTGKINHDVVKYWRDHNFDLRYYLEKNWKELGPKLVGKLHFLCGDMDNFYLNNSLYLMEEFLESTKDPYYGGSFRWGRPKVGHTIIGLGVEPWPFKLLKEMAAHITKNAPRGEDTKQWKYE